MWQRAAAVSCTLGLLAGCGSGSPPRVEDLTPDTPETGAVRELGDEELSGQHVESVEELLRGRVPGLQVVTQPNGDLTLRIRGMDSLQPGPHEPLLVIDGMAISSTNVARALQSLRPTQVRTVQVLKDVASTSVYGIRGANGVILITTRRQ